MSQNSYFTQLRQEFQNDPYRDRFLAELEDHAEDLAEEQNLSPKSLNLNFMKKHFGDPKQIKKDFISVTRPWQKWLEAAEALGYGVLALFSLSFTSILPYTVEVQRPFLFIFFFLIYFLIWRKLFLFSESLLSKKILFTLVMLPNLIFYIFLLWAIYSQSTESNAYLALTPFSVAAGILASVVVFIQLKKPKNLHKKRRPILQILAAIFFFYVLSYSTLRILNPTLFFELYSWSLTPLWNILFLPIQNAELGLMYLPSAFTGSIIWLHYFQILIVLSFLFGGLIYFFVKKRFSWLACAAVIFSLSLLFVPQKSLEKSTFYPTSKLYFQVPYEDVSKMIQGRQFGLFQNLVSYLENRVLFGLGYGLDFDKDQFILSQFGKPGWISWEIQPQAQNLKGNAFGFDPEKKELVRLPFDPYTRVLNVVPIWPEGFECWNKEGILADDIPCSKLLFHSLPLLSGEFYPHSVALSSDQQHLMISLTVAGHADSVYVLDLSKIKSQ